MVGGHQAKEFFMKNKIKIVGIIVLLAVVGFSASSCAILSSVGGTGDPHGLFTFSDKPVSEGFSEIASYMVILGLFDSGYKDYAPKVKAAEASGKQVTSVTKFYAVLTITTAYAK